ncbi:heterogeneous nuclear ribonucleoprotein F [Aphelenchoides avenae]|nr:heterogeneous nuclear ribonucleoprotein F [Aphelenchus avenae]
MTEENHDFTSDPYTNGNHNNGATLNTEGNGAEPSQDADCYVRLRGLPYTASEASVRQWFEGIPVVSAHMTVGSDGRPSGEAYLQLPSNEHVQEALKKDRGTMGNRYIEVFAITNDELQLFLKRLEVKRSLSDKGFIRVRGLPYNCKREELDAFFKDLTIEEVVFGKELGLGSRPSGEAYIKFPQKSEADRALALSGQHLGHRWLEIFPIDGEAFSLFKDRMTGPVPLAKLPPMPPKFAPSWDAWAPPPYAAGPGYGLDDGYGGGYGGGRAPRGRPPRGGGRGGRGGGGGGRYNPYGPPAPQPLARSGYNYGGYGDDGYGGGGYGGAYGSGGYEAGPPAGGYDPYAAGYGAGGGGGNYGDVGPTKVFMRGLPFRVTFREVEEFFAPIVCVDVKFGVLPDGRASGDGIVEFRTPADAQQALQKDRGSILNRYVELFPTESMRLPAQTRYQSAIKVEGGYTPHPPAPLKAEPAYATGYPPQHAGYDPYATAAYDPYASGSVAASGYQW